MDAKGASRGVALAWGIAFAAAMLFAFGGSDLWWHVRTGRWIWEHGAIPTTDPFSHTAPGPWRYTEALAQLILYAAYAAGGIGGLAAVHLALGAALGYAVARLVDQDAGATGLVVGLVGAASLPAMALKPQLFSYMLFAVLLRLLYALEARVRRGAGLLPLLVVPPLFLLWELLHRGGVLGLFVLGAAAVGWALDPGLRPRLPALVVASAAALGLVLLGPGGVYYVTSAFDVATRAGFEHLGEWAPLDAGTFLHRHFALVPLVAAWVSDRWRHARRVDTELFVVLGAGLLLARSGRLAPFFAIALAPGAGRSLARGLSSLHSRRVRPVILRAVAGGLGLAALAGAYVHTFEPVYWGVGVVEERVPVRLAWFLRAAPPGGHMWNSFDLGGYLLFALSPHQRVFIDGRNDTVYDGAFFTETLQAPQDPEVFAEQMKRYDIGYVVARSADLEAPSLRMLGDDPRWALVYLDDVGAVFVRRDRVSAAYLRRYAYDQLRPADALARAATLGSSAADARFVGDVARYLARSPESLRAHYLAALLARRRGDRTVYRSERTAVARLARRRGLTLPPP